MLSIPKQQSHTRKNYLQYLKATNNVNNKVLLHSLIKNWADEVQIYMSLKDHSLSNIMEDLKREKITINDANYIDFKLHEQGLGQKDAF
eukprot:6161805-Amphidinium_carterae.1